MWDDDYKLIQIRYADIPHLFIQSLFMGTPMNENTNMVRIYFYISLQKI